MKPSPFLRSFLALAGSSLLAMSSASAFTFYWDSDGTTAGLGNTAGTWGSTAFFHAITAAETRGPINGTLGTFASQAGASGDTFYFGTVDLGLGTTASTIGTTGVLTTTNLVIGAGQTNNLTFSAGGTITMAGTTPTIAVNNASTTTTIDAILGGTVGMTKAGSGTLTLTNASNSLTGGVIIRDGGRLNLGNGTSGGFTASTNALTFNNGGGTFNLAQADTGSQTMGALTFSGGDGSVISTAASGAATQTLTFSSLAARAAGATGNFALATNTTAADNKIVLGGAATGFLDKGLFFGGSSYAAYDATGYVRGLIYGTDTNAAATNTITASNHVQLTSSPAARTGDTLLSLNLSGGGVDYTMNAGSLTVPAILKSGGGAVSTISGGTSLTTAGNAELVIRTDTASDLLTISSAVTGFSGGLTKTGAGTLTLSGGNGYTGATRINAGTLAVSGGSAIADNQAVVLANAAGATFQLNSSETIGNLSGGGFSGGNVNVQGNTLTLSDNSSQTFGGLISGTSGGGFVKQGSGTLKLSMPNTFAGTITVSGGTLEFTIGNLGSTSALAISSGGTISLAGGAAVNFLGTTDLLTGQLSPQTSQGLTISNALNVSSGTGTVRFGGNGNKFIVSGGATAGTSGSQILAISAGSGSLNLDSGSILFSGSLADGGGGGTLGLSVTYDQSGNGQNAFVNLRNSNPMSGPITTTYLDSGGAGNAYLVIGGERTSSSAITIGSGSIGVSANYTNTIALGLNTILNYASTANQTLGGQISGGGSLLKEGSGTLTLSATNTYTGATTISTGTLNLGGSNGSLDSTVLNMAGGTLNYTRTGGTTEAFTTTNITAGANTITAVATNTLTLGSLVKTGAATVNFGTTGTITTSTLNDATGILGGWATFGDTNWAVANGAGSAITGFAGTYTMTGTVLNAGASYNAVNIGVNSSQAPNTAITPNTLTFDTSGAYTLTLTGTTNTIPGILVNSTVGNNASLITGGTLRGTNNGTLNISQNNTNALGALTIGSIIANNGTSGLNKSGAGTLILTTNATYTGVTAINAGTLQLGNGGTTGTLASTSAIVNNSSLFINHTSAQTLAAISGTGSVTYTGGAGSLTLNTGNTFSGGFTLNSGSVVGINTGTYGGFGSGTLTVTGGAITGSSSSAVTINNDLNWGGSILFNRAGGSSGTPTLTFTGALTLSNNLAINLGISTTAGAAAFTNNISGAYGINVVSGGPSSGNLNALTLSGANNTFSGGLSLGTGSSRPMSLYINSATALGATAGTFTIAGTQTITIDNTSAAAITLTNNNPLAFNNGFTFTGTRDLNMGTGAVNLGGGTRSITTTAGTFTLGGVISNGALTKAGAGTLVLSGANNYSGTTTITAGTLQLDGSTHASSTVGVGTAGTLSGSGTVNGSATLTGGGIINMTSGTIAGTLAVTGGNWNGVGTVTGLVTSSGTFTIGSSANLTATTGVTTTGGALVINGTLTGALNANVSTTVSGTGIVSGNTTIQGAHNPGNSPGIQTYLADLTYSGGASVVNWELTANTDTNLANPNAIFDQITVGGDLNFAGATAVNLSFVALGSAVLWSNSFWDTDQSWTLYDVTGTTSNFPNLTLNTSNWFDSGSFDFNTARPDGFFSLDLSGNDVILNYTAVPEPGAALIGSLGLLALLRRRRN